jgi:hypothetical protein
MVATGVMATAALASFSGPGTAHLDNGPIAFDPSSCGTQLAEPFFVINQISPTGALPHTIQITFQNSSGGGTTTVTSTGFSSQGGGQNFHYWIDLPSSASYTAITDATVVVPAGTSIGEFVWSHTDCVGGTPPPPPPPPPPVSATPELDSLLLFGSGALGLSGYALTRWRARRKAS